MPRSLPAEHKPGHPSAGPRPGPALGRQRTHEEQPMRALDFPERAAPGAPLILDLDIDASPVAHLGADRKCATRPPARTMRARIRRQLTDQENGIVSGRVTVQEPGNKGSCLPNLITAPRKGKGATAHLRGSDTSLHPLIAHSRILAVVSARH